MENYMKGDRRQSVVIMVTAMRLIVIGDQWNNHTARYYKLSAMQAGAKMGKAIAHGTDE